MRQATFEILEYPYAKDKDAVYYEGKKVSGVDAATFKILSHGYAKDKDAVYIAQKKIAGANALGFEVFKENDDFTDEFCFTKDNAFVFFHDKKLSDADLTTFKPLGNNYGSDNQHVFYKTKIIKDAQSTSFKVYPHDVGDADAEEANGRYHKGKRLVEE